MVSHPFDTTGKTLSSFTAPWMSSPMPLSYILSFFYDVHAFKVYVTGADGSDSGASAFNSAASSGGLAGAIQQPTSLNGNSAAAYGLSKRQMQVPPNILNQIKAATIKANAPGATQGDKDALVQLKSKSQTTAAPGESKLFLRVADINTKCAYPIHKFSSNLVELSLDFGSTLMLGQGQKFPNPRDAIPAYNRYTSPFFAPAVSALVGSVGSSVGAYVVGSISLGIDDSGGGYGIDVYGDNPDTSFVSGTLVPRERYSDLHLTPRFGKAGTTVNIAIVQNPSKAKSFSGFKNVKKVSFNGYDVTSSFKFSSKDVPPDQYMHVKTVNESCSVGVPSGAQSGYFTFYSEESSPTGGLICNQFTVPEKFIVTS